MKYLKKFEEKALFDSYINGNSVLPNVSYVMDVDQVFYNPLVERNNVIRYYSSQKENVKEILGNSIISHEFSNGVGTIVYSKDVTKLPYDFMENNRITSIELPNSVTTIEYMAFSDCTSLESIELPNSVTTIESSAFDNCTSLTYVRIPNSVTTIEHSVFNNCTSLESIELPDSVTTIEYSTFNNCTSLTYVKIPDSVTTIEYSAFDGCTSLKELYYDGNMSQYKQIIWKGGNDYNLSIERVICLDGVIELTGTKIVSEVSCEEDEKTVRLDNDYYLYFNIIDTDDMPITSSEYTNSAALGNYHYLSVYDDSVIEIVDVWYDMKDVRYVIQFKALKVGTTDLFIYAGPGLKDPASTYITINVTE